MAGYKPAFASDDCGRFPIPIQTVIVAVGLPTRQQLVSCSPVAELLLRRSTAYAEAGSDKPPLRRTLSQLPAVYLPNQFGATETVLPFCRAPVSYGYAP